MTYLAWIICVAWLASLTAIVTFTVKELQTHKTNVDAALKAVRGGCNGNCACKK